MIIKVNMKSIQSRLRALLIAMLGAICGLAGWYLPHVSRAQQNGAIAVEPFMQEVTLEQQQAQQTFPLRITNTSSEETHISFSIIDFGQLQESGGIAFLGSSKEIIERKYGLAAWLQIDQQEVTIAPGETVIVTATVINKASLSPGGHYAAIVGSVKDDSTILQDRVAVQQAFSALVLVKKKGGEVYNLNLQRAEHDASWLHIPEKVQLHFNNSGNVHLFPRGVVTLENSSGEVVSKGIINNGSIPILPETIRTLNIYMDKLAPVWLPGIYKLRIQYRYDGREEFAEAQYPIIFVGWHAVAILFGVLVMIAWVVLKKRSGDTSG